MRILISFIFIFQSTYINAKEYKIYPAARIEYYKSKIPHAKIKNSIFKIELDSNFVDSNLKTVVYPVFEYNSSEEKFETTFRKAYITYLMEMKNEIYMYINLGKQPIFWGVGRGLNPTNFLKELQLLEKQQKEYVLEEGIEAICLTFSYNELSLENIVSFSDFLSDPEAYAIRLKSFLFNKLDADVIYYNNMNNGEKFGTNLECDIGGLFNLYSEVAFDKKNYQGLIGLTKQISLDYNVSIEYFKIKDKKGSIFFQLNCKPKEEINGLFIVSYDNEKNITYFMPRLNLYLTKNTEIGFAPIFTDYNKDFDCEIIKGEVIYKW